MTHGIEHESPDTEGRREIRHWTVECPETGGLAEADITARAAPFPTSCKPRLTVKNCSLWPERKACGQKCLSD